MRRTLRRQDWGTDIIALLERRKTDGLIIATPGHTHVPLASGALDLGIPVLVEKPVAMTAAEAALLVEAMRAALASSCPGMCCASPKPHRMIADIVRSGEIGRVLALIARRHRDDSHALRYPDIDPVMMTMIHDIDLALWMARCSGCRSLWRCAALPASSAPRPTMSARDRNGAAWTLATAWTFPSMRIRPTGSKSSASVAASISRRARICANMAPRPARSTLRDAPDDPLASEVAYFVHCIRSGARPEAVTVATRMHGLMIAEAALASLRDGGIVRLPELSTRGGLLRSNYAVVGFMECPGQDRRAQAASTPPFWDDLNVDRAGTESHQSMMSPEDVAEVVMLQLRLPLAMLL